ALRSRTKSRVEGALARERWEKVARRADFFLPGRPRRSGKPPVVAAIRRSDVAWRPPASRHVSCAWVVIPNFVVVKNDAFADIQLMARPSLLAVTSEMPWPLDSGGHLRSFHLLRTLTDRFDVRLVVPSSGSDEAGRAALEAAGVRVHLVPVAPRKPLAEALKVVTG